MIMSYRGTSGNSFICFFNPVFLLVYVIEYVLSQNNSILENIFIHRNDVIAINEQKVHIHIPV